jgi:hypothetical protein
VRSLLVCHVRGCVSDSVANKLGSLGLAQFQNMAQFMYFGSYPVMMLELRIPGGIRV